MDAAIVRLMMWMTMYILKIDTTSKVGDMVKVRILQGFTEDLVGELADV